LLAGGGSMIDVERSDGIAVVRLRHGKVNALDLELAETLTATMRDLSDSAVVLTGHGSVFSAGVDLRRLLDGGPEYAARFLTALDNSLLTVFDAPGPVVAAINGHAIAGGCILAVACDVRLMSGGTIGVPELFVGLPFPAAGLEIVRHAAGSRADELAFTGRSIDAAAAQAIGLVHEIAPAESLLDQALERANALARIPRTTYRMAKEQLRCWTRERIESARRRDDERIVGAWQSGEARAAVSAYLDRLGQRGGER
jgi:enoyl-CoA hydratase